MNFGDIDVRLEFCLFEIKTRLCFSIYYNHRKHGVMIKQKAQHEYD